MRAKLFSSSFEDALVENTWFRLAIALLYVPMAILLLCYLFGEQIVVGWFVLLGAYAVALIVGAVSWRSGEQKTFRMTRTFVRIISPFVLGGLATLFYYMLLIVYLTVIFEPV